VDIIQFDKQLLLQLCGSQSLFLDSLVTTLTHAATWIPLYISLLYVVIKNSDNARNVILVLLSAGLCVLLAGTIDDSIVKPIVARWRPTRDPEIGILVDVVNQYRGGNYGFFSAHASNTFSIAIFFCLLIRSKVLSIAMVLWSLINCWTRMYLGVHYPGDILVGLLWGGIVGTVVYMLYRRLQPQPVQPACYVSTQYTSTGYQANCADIVIVVLMFTLVYAIVRACLF
jgi:undecaprenyl-diphosphatase